MSQVVRRWQGSAPTLLFFVMIAGAIACSDGDSGSSDSGADDAGPQHRRDGDIDEPDADLPDSGIGEDASPDDASASGDASASEDSDTADSGDESDSSVANGCADDGDCPGAHCVAHACVHGPTAGFMLSATSGVIPFPVHTTSNAVEGDAPIVSTRYAFTGGGFGTGDSYRYLEAGEYQVRQEVQDENGLTDIASLTVTVTGFAPVRFSATDHSPLALLSPDRLSVENRGEDRGGARSDDMLQPGSGVFYFEAERLIDETGVWGIGVGTAAAALDNQIGTSVESLGLDTYGEFGSTGATCTGASNFDRSNRYYGFVVDYRGTNPRIHIVLEDGDHKAIVRRTCVMAVTAPLFITYAGVRYHIGYQLKLNTGSDLTNFPLHFSPADLQAALTSAGAPDAAALLVPGFGRSRAPVADAPPMLVVPGDQAVAVGAAVHLSATAADAEDGDLTGAIVWTDLASQHHAPLTAVGGEFSFTPGSVGRHPIAVRVTDWDGVTTERVVMVTVNGSLPQASSVQLVKDDLSGPLLEVVDGLQVRFVDQGKYGIRANQGIYGQFWYFEAHRVHGPQNQGIGLIIKDGALNPYRFEEPPWSCSINLTGSTWRNLISLSGWNDLVATTADYGFAVDYRGTHPIVYVLIGGTLHDTLTLDDVWVPLFPMVYGNPRNVEPPDSIPPPIPAGEMDVVVNFGASPFVLDARTILNANGIDTTGLELGWGDVNTP